MNGGKVNPAVSSFYSIVNTEPLFLQESRNIDEINNFQYQVEKSCASAVRNTMPFSQERSRILFDGYRTVDELIAYKSRLSGKNVSYGASPMHLKWVDTVLDHISKEEKITFFEAGIGTGYILTNISKRINLRIQGCDLVISDTLKKKFGSFLIQDTIYNALSHLEDNSIDIFYWNDVLEHIPEDEVLETLKLVYKKIAPRGIIMTFTPNRGTGPHDITHLVNPESAIAQGLHFKEYLYAEVYRLMRYVGFSPFGMVQDIGGELFVDYNYPAWKYSLYYFKERLYNLISENINTISFGKHIYHVRRRLMKSFTSASLFIKV